MKKVLVIGGGPAGCSAVHQLHSTEKYNITLVEKSEVDPKIFLEVLNSTYFKTGMSENKAFKMIDGDYDATFTLSNLKKDISTMISTSKKLGIELPMIMKAEKIYENAIKEGLGNNDYTGIIEYIKKINKV